jgi:hypothetical protein
MAKATVLALILLAQGLKESPFNTEHYKWINEGERFVLVGTEERRLPR